MVCQPPGKGRLPRRLPLEAYAQSRADFRARVLNHSRHLALGPHAALYFEDRLTVPYQIQEMLRTERILKIGANLSASISHPKYSFKVAVVDLKIRDSLAVDVD